MVESLLSPESLEITKVVLVAILMFTIIFAMLKMINIFGESNSVNAVIALVSAIIVLP